MVFLRFSVTPRKMVLESLASDYDIDKEELQESI